MVSTIGCGKLPIIRGYTGYTPFVSQISCYIHEWGTPNPRKTYIKQIVVYQPYPATLLLEFYKNTFALGKPAFWALLVEAKHVTRHANSAPPWIHLELARLARLA